MENSLFIITIIALALVAFLTVAILIIASQILKFKLYQQGKSTFEQQPQMSVRPEFKTTTLAPKEPELPCKNHPKSPAIATCAICEEPLCQHCVKTHKSLQFCLKHLEVFLTGKWEEVTSVLTNPDEPIKGVYLYNFKAKLWKEKQIPTYIQTQYKIDIDHDRIESYVVLLGRKNDLEAITSSMGAPEGTPV